MSGTVKRQAGVNTGSSEKEQKQPNQDLHDAFLRETVCTSILEFALFEANHSIIANPEPDTMPSYSTISVIQNVSLKYKEIYSANRNNSCYICKRNQFEGSIRGSTDICSITSALSLPYVYLT